MPCGCWGCSAEHGLIFTKFPVFSRISGNLSAETRSLQPPSTATLSHCYRMKNRVSRNLPFSGGFRQVCPPLSRHSGGRDGFSRREGRCRRGSLSGGIWGSTFSYEYIRQHRAATCAKLALLPLKPEQLALFGPVGGEFEGQPRQPLRAELRRVFTVDDGRDDIGRERR